MLVLAADTSLPILSVALIDDTKLIGALAIEGRGSRNEKLLPAVDFLLTENGVDPSRIDLYAATRGPGSFTGVRIGLATMQGLAIAAKRPLCAISTHEAIAHGETGTVNVVDDAGRGEWYVSTFADGIETAPPHLATARPETGRSILVAEFLEISNVALLCARRARDLELRGEGSRYRDITPIYVRLAEAEVKLRQKTHE